VTRIARLLRGDRIIYIAGRLFDIDDKLKSEALEETILAGVRDAADSLDLPVERRVTFVPFRDANQEQLVVEDKTRRLFELDLVRLNRTTLLVAYIDGLAKDEGVCFEIGYAYTTGAAILLISTDFFDIELPNGTVAPVDPLLCAVATRIVRQPGLAEIAGTFREVLTASRTQVMAEVRATVWELLMGADPEEPMPMRVAKAAHRPRMVFLDFGGTVFEWQELLQDELDRLTQSNAGITLVRSRRYDSAANVSTDAAATCDLAALAQAHILVSCTDGDEASAGTAFLQGVMCALGRPVWMYNSKRTAIRAAGGYRSSRNLMLDYSATRTFQTLSDLAAALRGI
jgi:nucleoside 2-deoxyribosyltransferase